MDINSFNKLKIMTAKKDMTLTSVKVKSDLFENFKIECVKRKFSFQKLADRAIHLYLTDDDFRKQINNHNNLEL
jgi:predicted DNA binding CopG/RHH family protein